MCSFCYLPVLGASFIQKVPIKYGKKFRENFGVWGAVVLLWDVGGWWVKVKVEGDFAD